MHGDYGWTICEAIRQWLELPSQLLVLFLLRGEFKLYFLDDEFFGMYLIFDWSNIIFFRGNGAL